MFFCNIFKSIFFLVLHICELFPIYIHIELVHVLEAVLASPLRLTHVAHAAKLQQIVERLFDSHVYVAPLRLHFLLFDGVVLDDAAVFVGAGVGAFPCTHCLV